MNKRVFVLDQVLTTIAGDNGADIIETLNSSTQPNSDNDENIPLFSFASFDSKSYVKRLRERRFLNRGALFAVINGIRVWERHNHIFSDLTRGGIFVGCGPNLAVSEEQEKQAGWILQHLPNTIASVLGKRCGILGESATFTTACAASVQALGNAYEKIAHGVLDFALVVTGDSRISTRGLSGYRTVGALFESEKNYSPFSQEEFGFVPGEGGSAVLLVSEKYISELKKQYVEVVAHSSSLDCYSLTSPHPSGDGLKRAVLNGLKSSNLSSNDIDIVVAHGTGTELNDQVELESWKELSPQKRALIVANKSWIGHLSSASGLTELSLLLETLEMGVIPKIQHAKHNFDINLNRENSTVLSTDNLNIIVESMGFGGQNSVVILKRGFKEIDDKDK